MLISDLIVLIALIRSYIRSYSSYSSRKRIFLDISLLPVNKDFVCSCILDNYFTLSMAKQQWENDTDILSSYVPQITYQLFDFERWKRNHVKSTVSGRSSVDHLCFQGQFFLYLFFFPLTSIWSMPNVWDEFCCGCLLLSCVIGTKCLNILDSVFLDKLCCYFYWVCIYFIIYLFIYFDKIKNSLRLKVESLCCIANGVVIKNSLTWFKI